MKNQIYRIDLSKTAEAEFYVCETNELDPYRDVLEMGFVVLDRSNDLQLDGDMDLDEPDSLIKYLKECRECIYEFNKNSKAVYEPEAQLTK